MLSIVSLIKLISLFNHRIIYNFLDFLSSRFALLVKMYCSQPSFTFVTDNLLLSNIEDGAVMSTLEVTLCSVLHLVIEDLHHHNKDGIYRDNFLM